MRDKPVKIYKARNANDVLHRFDYGVGPSDAWSLDTYLARVMSNGLRLLAEQLHAWPAIEEYAGDDGFEKWRADILLTAAKLDFYASDLDSELFDHIDFSHDEDHLFEDVDAFIASINMPREEHKVKYPGSYEYGEKSMILEKMRCIYRQEAFEWLNKWWGGLWD